MAAYYPSTHQEDVEMIAILRKRALLKLDQLIDGKSRKKEIEKIERRLRELVGVTDYAAYERESDVGFEQGCLSITEQLHKDAKLMTVMEYEAAIKLLTERSKRLDDIKKHKKK